MVIEISRAKARALAVLFTNFAAVFLGSLVIPIFIGGFDVRRVPMVLLGLLATFFSTWLSLLFAERGKL